MNTASSDQDTELSGIPDTWDENAVERVADDPLLNVDVDGYEGPLDLLLELSRHQKVDLAKISILALAEQYLAFIESAHRLRIELAADYLVMASWLAYLKSKLLLPADDAGDGELSGEEMAAQLAFRLKRLEAMREAGKRLVNRNRLGRDFFARGNPEAIVIDRQRKYSATLYDLLSAYASRRQRQSQTEVTIARREVWSLQDARDILCRMMGEFQDWSTLDTFLLRYMPDPAKRNSAIASTFTAALELVREGQLKIRQETAYAPLYLKAASGGEAVSNEIGER